MLNTLLKIGEWQSQGKDEWDRFLDYPKVENEDKKGNETTNLTLSILFDLDEMEVIIDKGNIKEYDKNDIARFKAIKVKGGNNKANYVTVPSSKLVQLYKTFYGKEGSEGATSEMIESINKTNPSLLTEELKEILDLIYQLKGDFLEQINPENQDKITSKPLESLLELGKNENLVLITTQIKSEKYGFSNPTYFADIPDYHLVLEDQYLSKIKEVKSAGVERLCYARGEVAEDVSVMDLKRRDSLNKMFGAETYFNYFSGFKKASVSKNYQVSEANKALLDVGSAYLLKNERTFNIAGVKHCLIPEFLHDDNIDVEMALSHTTYCSEVLFSLKPLSEISQNIQDWTQSIFWINLIALEMPLDKSYLKSYGMIKDISVFHFDKILNAFTAVDWSLKESVFFNWDSIMLEYDYNTKLQVRRNFNFLSLYKLIPIRKDKEKKNKALDLFKSILENRKVEYTKLFDYFCELILCHYYERYNSYTNVAKSSKDYFGKSVRDSVFKYLAFIQVLKKLNLIDMDEISTTAPEEAGNKYDRAIQSFFDKMRLNQDQQAMFYLGRMLNAVEYIQKDKNKTVIQKVNFNGMDRDDIQRLRNGLLEKAKQYSKIGKVIFTDGKFGELFDYNRWGSDPMNPQEAVFFLMTGYSFGIGNKEANEIENAEQPEIN